MHSLSNYIILLVSAFLNIFTILDGQSSFNTNTYSIYSLKYILFYVLEPKAKPYIVKRVRGIIAVTI